MIIYRTKIWYKVKKKMQAKLSNVNHIFVKARNEYI